jgi:hypothetical protein
MADGPQRADGMKLRHTVIVMLTGEDLIFGGRMSVLRASYWTSRLQSTRSPVTAAQFMEMAAAQIALSRSEA